MISSEHEQWMRRAIELAQQAPKLPFGAVIIDRTTGEIVAEGFNQSKINPTWHGEIVAINDLASRGNADREDLALYTTAEPCPMCQGAILWSNIHEVVFGTSIRYLQKTGWRQIDILASEVIDRAPHWRCQLVGGVLEEECNALFDQAMQQRE